MIDSDHFSSLMSSFDQPIKQLEQETANLSFQTNDHQNENNSKLTSANTNQSEINDSTKQPHTDTTQGSASNNNGMVYAGNNNQNFRNRGNFNSRNKQNYYGRNFTNNTNNGKYASNNPNTVNTTSFFNQHYNNHFNNITHHHHHPHQQQPPPFFPYNYQAAPLNPSSNTYLTSMYPTNFNTQFYSTNDINTSKQSYMMHRSYIQAKKAENLHKLWPHSANKNKLFNSNKDKSSKETDQTNKQVEPSSTTTNSTPASTAINTTVSNNATNTNNSGTDTSKNSMCQINELVKFNKIKHEYVLLDEIGPAHKKLFFVSLKLGIGSNDSSLEESYSASGTSIKKAQHAAAEIALKQTKFKKPVKRSNKSDQKENANQTDQTNVSKDGDSNGLVERKSSEINLNNRKPKSSLSPTVLLNSLAMKLGLVANYKHRMTSSINNQDYSSIVDYNNIDSSLNYTSFSSNSIYEPFKYPSNQFQIGAPNYSYFNNQRGFNKIRKANDPYMEDFKQLYVVELKFAGREFTGKGSTLQFAKHDAASQALNYFSNPENFLQAKELAASQQNKSSKAYRPPQFYKNKSNESNEPTKTLTILKNPDRVEQQNENKTTSTNEKNDSESVAVTQSKIISESKSKSDIMLLNEYASRLKKLVNFELMSESGPSHNKVYVTKCSFGTKIESNNMQTTTLNNENKNSFYLEVSGEGNSKKLSKKNAAIHMLNILKEKFEPLFLLTNPSNGNKNKSEDLNSNAVKASTDENNSAATQSNESKKSRKNKAKNLIKVKKTSPEYGKGSINPISRLIQIQQAKNDKEPLFELVNNDLNTNKRLSNNYEFIMKCTIKRDDNTDEVCEGKGYTKKQAKQKAAEAMLAKLGYQPSINNKKSALKQTNSVNKSAQDEETAEKLASSSDNDDKQEKTRRVKFQENVITIEHTPTVYAEKDQTNESNKGNHANKKSPSINTQQKQALKIVKDQLTSKINAKSEELNKKIFDKNGLELVYKIASELLDSVSIEKQTNDKTSFIEFKSPTLESLKLSNESTAKELKNENEENESIKNDIVEATKFNLLNGGDLSTNKVNYKKMLEYLADEMEFKVNCQSLLGRDGVVLSYVNLSILPETEKPLNGQGATYIESSNNASLCALEYLSSKHVKK